MSEEIIGERIIQMDWICRPCKHRNPGLEGEDDGLKCAKCGNNKDVERYLMPDDTYAAPTVTDPRLLALAYAGENQTCKRCGKEVRAGKKECSYCGAGMNKKPVPRPPRPVVSPTFVTDEEEEQRALQRMRGASTGSSSAMKVAVVGALVLVGAFLVWLFMPHKTVATVSSVSWKYIEHLEERSVQHGSGWRRPAPESEYFNVTCERKQRGTRECNPHDCNCHDEKYDCNCTGGDTYDCNPHKVSYDCNCTGGDTYKCNCEEKEDCSELPKRGAAKCVKKRICDTCTHPRKCEKCKKTEYDTCRHPRKCETCTKNVCDTCYDQCPVYDNWCEYDYYHWSEIRKEETTGTDLKVRWFGFEPRAGEQRVRREEAYVVTLAAGSRSWTNKPESLADFQRFPPGKRFLIEYTYAGTHKVIGPAE